MGTPGMCLFNDTITLFHFAKGIEGLGAFRYSSRKLTLSLKELLMR